MAFYLHYEWIDDVTGDDVFVDLKFDTYDDYLRVKQDIEAHPEKLDEYERRYADGYTRPEWLS